MPYKNKQAYLDYQKKYYQENKQDRKEYFKEYQGNNKKKISERDKEYYERNKDKINERRRELRKQNPEKHNEYHRKRRANFTEEQKRASLDSKNDYRRRVAEFVQSEKYPCIVCGEDDPVVLDWHHIDPSTKSCAVACCRTFPSAQAEIAKCTCLCANCHRRHHAGTIDIGPYLINHKQV